MKRNLRGQMVGFHHPCVYYDEHKSFVYYDFLHEADEFGAAAGAYPDERAELLANSAHRYQLLVDMTVANLNLNVSFLNKGKIWFNFYSEIATHFGLGTQAYTTETRKPHVGISEITLQDNYLLQLILLHEMQHAIDFANYQGLQMSISEREFRARISICEGIRAIKEQQQELYANSLQDLCYWYILLFLTSSVSDARKLDYYHLLNEDAQAVLASDGENRGVLFSPLVLRSLSKELMRDKINIDSFNRYAIDLVKGKLHLHLLSLNPEDEEVREPDNLEEMMFEDDELVSNLIRLKDITKDELKYLSQDYSRELVTARNKMTDWHTYDKAYAKLKEQAKAAIERDKPSFSEVQIRLEKGAGHSIDRQLFPQLQDLAGGKKEEAELPPDFVPPAPVEPAAPLTREEKLASIALPDAEQETEEANEMDKELGAMPVQLTPLQRGLRQRHNIEDDQPMLQDSLSDLSDFVKHKGGR